MHLTPPPAVLAVPHTPGAPGCCRSFSQGLPCVLSPGPAAAEAIKVVERRGSWYYFGEVRLAQGREKALEAIKEDEALRRWAGQEGGSSVKV